MRVQVIFFIECVQSALQYSSAALGWSETWYIDDGSIFNLDDFFTYSDVTGYVAMRRYTLRPSYRIAWVRVSEIANPFNFKVQALNGMVGRADAGGIGTVHDGQVNCALLVDLAAGPIPIGENPDRWHHRRFLMRALPSDCINGNVVNTGASNWTNVKNFLDWIGNRETGQPNPSQRPSFMVAERLKKLGIQAQQHTDFTPVTAVNPVPGDAFSVALSNPPDGLVKGDRLTFRGFPDGVRDLNRIWTVMVPHIATTPPTAILGRARRSLQNVTYAGPGPALMRIKRYIYEPFGQYTIIGLRTKSTGRLFRQLRGRSRNR